MLVNQSAQYELCYGNKFHKNPEGFNIKSTGFSLTGKTGKFFFTDTPGEGDIGVLSVVREINDDGQYEVAVLSLLEQLITLKVRYSSILLIFLLLTKRIILLKFKHSQILTILSV